MGEGTATTGEPEPSVIGDCCLNVSDTREFLKVIPEPEVAVATVPMVAVQSAEAASRTADHSTANQMRILSLAGSQHL